MLNPLPLHGFALEPAAITLPPSTPVQRTSTSEGTGAGHGSWAPQTELRSLQQRPPFFESAFQQQQYQSTPSNPSSTPYYSSQYSASPLALGQGQTPLPSYSSTPVATQQQQQPSYVLPTSGSSGVQFVPFLERDDKNDVFAFDSMYCRSEWAAKSPEEVRLEDYIAAGAVPPLPTPVAPGPVDMGLQAQQQQQQQPQPQSQSVFGQSLFTQQAPSGGLFGTASVGLFPTPSQPQQLSPQQQQSAFGVAPFQQQQQQQYSPSFFPSQQAPTSPHNAYTSAFGVTPQQSPSSIPDWGTATAGFGTPVGWGAQAPSPSPWNANSNSVFGQPTQQLSAFGSPSFGGGGVFGQQQQQQSQAYQPSPFGSAFGFFSQQPQQASAFGSGFVGCDQIPQSASFFWLDSSERCFEQWKLTLPSSISTVSFGGVSVALPTLEQCRAQREQEKERIAKCDADPYGLHVIRLGQIDTAPPSQPELESLQSGGGGSVPASPLRRGTSSPVLLPSPSRSPLIASGSSGSGSTLHPPTPGTPGHHGRSLSLSASLHHSPRLGPLPESPYVDQQSALLKAAPSSPQLGPRAMHNGTPERSMQRSLHLSSSPAHGHGYGPAPLHPSPSSVLFGSQQDASYHSPSRPLHLRTPHHDHLAHTSRELHWAARLVE